MPDYEQVKVILRRADSGLVLLIGCIILACAAVGYLAQRRRGVRWALNAVGPGFVPALALFINPLVCLAASGVVFGVKALHRVQMPRRYASLLFIGLLALALRLPLMNQALWYDEAFTAHVASLPFDMLPAAVANDVHPPGYYLLMWLWARIGGDSPFALRLPSLAFGLAGLWLIYRMALALGFNRNTALVSALLMAVLPAAIYYSTEVRSYALFACVIYGAIIAIFTQRRWLLAALLALMPHLHNFGLIYASVILVCAIVANANWRGNLTAWPVSLGYGIGFGWFPFMLQQTAAISDGYWPYLSFGALFRPFLEMTIRLDSPNYSVLTVIPIVALTVLSLWALWGWFRTARGFTWLALVFGVPALVALISLVWSPIYVPRTFYPCMVALVVAWAHFLMTYRLSQLYIAPVLLVALVGFFQDASPNLRVPYGDLLARYCGDATALYYTSIPAAFVASENSALPGLAWIGSEDDAGTFTPDDLSVYGFRVGSIEQLSGQVVCIMQIDQPLTHQAERDYIRGLLDQFPHRSHIKRLGDWYTLHFHILEVS